MEIHEIIKNELEVLKELNDLLDLEKEVLIKDRASELPGIVDRKKELSKKIVEIEKIRLDIYKDKTAEDFVNEGKLSKDDFEALKSLVSIIKEKEETNLLLTKQSLNYIRLITSALNPNPRVVTYSSSGKVDDSKAVNIFTQKI